MPVGTACVRWPCRRSCAWGLHKAKTEGFTEAKTKGFPLTLLHPWLLSLSSRSCPCLLPTHRLQQCWRAPGPAQHKPSQENTPHQPTGDGLQPPSLAGALPRRMMRIPPSWERRYLAAPGSWPMRMQGSTVISRKMAGRPRTEAAIISARHAWTYPAARQGGGFCYLAQEKENLEKSSCLVRAQDMHGVWEMGSCLCKH